MFDEQLDGCFAGQIIAQSPEPCRQFLCCAHLKVSIDLIMHSSNSTHLGRSAPSVFYLTQIANRKRDPATLASLPSSRGGSHRLRDAFGRRFLTMAYKAARPRRRCVL